MGRYAEAIEFYDKDWVLRGNRPDNTPFFAIVAHVYAHIDKRSEAKRMLEGFP